MQSKRFAPIQMFKYAAFNAQLPSNLVGNGMYQNRITDARGRWVALKNGKAPKKSLNSKFLDSIKAAVFLL